MMRLIGKYILAGMVLTLCSCSKSESNIPIEIGYSPDVADIELTNDDMQMYDSGRNEAFSLLNDCRTTEDICDGLLEIRSRETAIRTNDGNRAAQAYLYGFKTAIVESGDTLATVIF